MRAGSVAKDPRATASERPRLHRHAWHPDTPRAVVALVHGFGEHAGRYGRLVDGLVAAGIAVESIDLRGHGRSEGRRGHIDRWDDYVEDVESLLAHARATHPELPLFLYGHSMGGLIALDVASRHQDELSGLVLSAPALRPLEVGTRALRLAARLLSRVWPTFSRDVPLGSISRDPEIVDAARADPLNHRRGSARWGTEGLAAIPRLSAAAPRLSLPLLVLHGSGDRVIDPAGSAWLVDAVRSEDCRLIVCPEAHHEPHNDVGWERVVDDVASWVVAHVPNGAPDAESRDGLIPSRVAP